MAKRRKTLKFVRFDIDLVWKYFALSNEEIGERVRDLMSKMYSQNQSQYVENNAMIKDAIALAETEDLRARVERLEKLFGIAYKNGDVKTSEGVLDRI